VIPIDPQSETDEVTTENMHRSKADIAISACACMIVIAGSSNYRII
jgi:hypothetical protein